MDEYYPSLEAKVDQHPIWINLGSILKVILVEGAVETDSIDVTLAPKCTDAGTLLKT